MRYFLSVSYQGTAFHGSQIQGSIPTVQLALNRALATLLREDVPTFGASRTDEGVHAKENFFHFDWEQPLPDNLMYRLNAVLPQEIACTGLYQPVHPHSANARFDALSRQYHYKIHTRKNPFLYQRAYFFPYKINHDVLRETAAILIGRHDFTTFSKRKTQSKNFFCTIEDAQWVMAEDEYAFNVRANRFLRGMVRALVGTQLLVARGKMSVSDFAGLFEKKDCRLANFSVPGHGLYLEKITYPKAYFTK